MSRLLANPPVEGQATRLAPPGRVLDEATQELMRRTEEEAYQRGRADGAASAQRQIEEVARRLGSAIEVAFRNGLADLVAIEAERGAEVVALAGRLAAAVLGRDPEGEGRVLLERARAAVEQLDHGPFTLELAPQDLALVDETALGLPAGSEIVANPALQPGEARVRGPWSHADLTRDTLLELAMEHAEIQRRATADGIAPSSPEAPGA